MNKSRGPAPASPWCVYRSAVPDRSAVLQVDLTKLRIIAAGAVTMGDHQRLAFGVLATAINLVMCALAATIAHSQYSHGV